MAKDISRPNFEEVKRSYECLLNNSLYFIDNWKKNGSTTFFPEAISEYYLLRKSAESYLGIKKIRSFDKRLERILDFTEAKVKSDKEFFGR